MNRTLSALIVSCLLLTLSACATAPPKQAALQGESVLTAMRGLTRAYESKDIDLFLEKISPPYAEKQSLMQTTAMVFSKYQTIRLKVHYTKMLIMAEDRGNIKATFTWEGEWQTSGGKTHKDGARTTFVFDPKEYKLLAVEGKNPFVLVENQGKQ